MQVMVKMLQRLLPKALAGTLAIGLFTSLLAGLTTPAVAAAHKTAPAYSLLDAAGAGDLNGVQLLLSKGANVEARAPESGDTPLMVAARNGYLPVVQALIAAKAKVNASNTNDYTALIFAAQNGRRAVAQALIAAGADVNAHSNNGAVAILSASAFGYPEIVKLLVAARANVNAKAGNGYTPLMLAAQNGYTQTVEILIAARANVNATANDGNTALRAASKKGFWGICKQLKDAGAH
ncbi:MAG: ankyrin repeat domain-containing protein [Rhizomicrobium sp.]